MIRANYKKENNMRAIFIIVISSFVLLISSCSDEQDLILPEKPPVVLQKCIMGFDAPKSCFEDELAGKGRANSNYWNNNDSLYIYLTNDSTRVGEIRAAYNSSTGQWNAEF